MALSVRHLIPRVLTLIAAALFVPAPTALRAQPAPPPPATFQVHAVSPLGDLFYNVKGRRLSVYAGPGGFSAPAVVPPGGSVDLYRLEPAPESGAPPVRVSVAIATLPTNEGAQTLLLIYPEGAPPPDDSPDTRPLRTLTFDQSPTGFPSGTIRVFSFSARPVAMKIGSTTVPVPTMQAVTVPYPNDRKTWLHVATVGEQGWQRVIGTPQSLGPNTRLSLFLRDTPPSLNDPKPVGLRLAKILETLPAPATPASP
jgi:hypothetical protein